MSRACTEKTLPGPWGALHHRHMTTTCFLPLTLSASAGAVAAQQRPTEAGATRPHA